MSRTAMYAAPDGGTFTCIAELRNSWGAAMRVWVSLGEKYFGDPYYVMTHADDFWPLWKDPRLTEDERAVFVSTFDKCLLRAEDAPRLAKLFREFAERHPVKEGSACHLRGMADVLDSLESVCIGFRPFAVGWHQTSVTPNQWGWKQTGPEDDDGRNYSLSTDDEHFWLFEEMESRLQTASGICGVLNALCLTHRVTRGGDDERT